ncbi:MAG: component of SufBCD complex [Silicimonas sp.]|nr:component of SufBCD complex [Silicimonas sp.]
MDWYESVFELIDLRSFSNLWYWVGLAVLWSSLSHWVLGVPHDAILRARRAKPETAMQDLQDLARINVNRILYIVDVSGAWLALFGSALATALGIIAFYYDVEFAQAVFFMLAPMIIIGGLSVATARRIRTRKLQGDDLIRSLMRHRFVVQLIGVVSIFITAMFGMWVNLYTGPFGGF